MLFFYDLPLKESRPFNWTYMYLNPLHSSILRAKCLTSLSDTAWGYENSYFKKMSKIKIIFNALANPVPHFAKLSCTSCLFGDRIPLPVHWGKKVPIFCWQWDHWKAPNLRGSRAMKVGKECRKSVVHAHTTESDRTIFKSTHYIYDSDEDKPQKPKKLCMQLMI